MLSEILLQENHKITTRSTSSSKISASCNEHKMIPTYNITKKIVHMIKLYFFILGIILNRANIIMSWNIGKLAKTLKGIFWCYSLLVYFYSTGKVSCILDSVGSSAHSWIKPTILKFKPMIFLEYNIALHTNYLVINACMEYKWLWFLPGMFLNNRLKYSK